MFRLAIGADTISIADSKGVTLSMLNRHSMKEQEVKDSVDSSETHEFHDILGVYKEDDSTYIALIEEVEQVSVFKQIHRVKRIKVVQLSHGADSPDFVAHIYRGFNQCLLFFSRAHDLTLTCQQELEGASTRTEFVFNHVPLQQLKDLWPSVELGQPVIGGFVREVEGIVLISRHSRFNVGIHVWRRGADENGHVANFVETEEIAVQQQRIYSFVQIRGSCPLFWSQNPTGELKRPFRYGPEKESHRRAHQHLDGMVKSYGPEISVCILTSRCGKEKRLTEEFEQIANERGMVCRQLDFNECMRREGAIAEFVHKFDDDIQVSEIEDGTIVRRQQRFVRSNCCSCLDRCNVFQAMLSGNALSKYLQNNTQRSQMWIDHANQLAMEYAAAPGQKTSIQDAGTQSFAGMVSDGINQATRFINSLAHEGLLDDSYSVVTQERKIRKYQSRNVISWIVLLLSSLLIYVVKRIASGSADANMYWRQKSREILCHPHYRDIRDADEYDESEFQ